jgi:hypothetical protein
MIFYGPSNRHLVIDGIRYDLYNGRIIADQGREKFIVFEDQPHHITKEYEADLFLHDLAPLIALFYVISYLFLGSDIKTYAKRLSERYPELGFKTREVVSRVTFFYAKFYTYRILLDFLAPKRVFLIAHYGKEAFIAACKFKGVEVTELMHGTILPNHPQYIYPEHCSSLFSSALFPDRLAVYGEYWKHVVVEGHMFPENSVVIGGYYLKVPQRTPRSTSSTQHVILISSQPTVQKELYAYITFLKSEFDSRKWQIIIKPHPMESNDAYEDLQQPGFIEISNESIYKLLAQSDFHISVYSSVLYEALSFDVSNYVLYLEKVATYCENIIQNGVAEALMPHQLPKITPKHALRADYYFQDYTPSVLFN